MDIVVENVRKTFGSGGKSEVLALDNVSHRFGSQKITCLLGPSGCGKSTLIQIIGHIITDSARPGGMTKLGAESVMMWQGLNLFPWRSVIDNVAFGPQMHGVAKSDRYARAKELLASVGLRGFEQHMPAQLSGGMRQRVALARALIMERPIMLMDEPFGALDAQTKIVMQEELLRIFDRTKKTILFVTHAIEEAILLGDEVLVMTARPGRIKEIIKVDLPRPRGLDILGSPEFAALFDRAFHLIRDEVTRAMHEQEEAVRA
jgi:NitT/TauT family transport system ATP-binding protein